MKKSGVRKLKVNFLKLPLTAVTLICFSIRMKAIHVVFNIFSKIKAKISRQDYYRLSFELEHCFLWALFMYYLLKISSCLAFLMSSGHLFSPPRLFLKIIMTSLTIFELLFFWSQCQPSTVT